MRKIIVIVSLGLLVACSGKKFSGNSPTGKETPPPKVTPNTEDSSVPIPNTPVTLPPPAKGLVDRCEEQAAKLQTITQDIVFPPTEGCPELETFSDEQTEKNQVHVTVFANQSVDLDLPNGEICSLNLDSQSDVITYDDFLVLTIEDRVLFSSNKRLVGFFSEDNGVYSFDFSKVKDKALGGNGKSDEAAWTDTQYCLGGGKCDIPRTEKEGNFDVKFEPKNFAPISLAINGKSSVPVTLNTTGDNDSTKDCKHTEINLKATIKFLPK